MSGARSRNKGAPVHQEILWKQIPIAPDYEISTDGRIRRLTPARTRRAGHELRLTRSSQVYIKAKLSINGAKHVFSVHRLMAITFLREPQPGEVARHLDDIKDHNVLDNIAWGSVADNSQDWIRNTGPKHGAANHNSILNDNAVRAIRAMHSAGKSISAIARDYGVGWTCIGDVVHGKKWTHVA